MEKVATNLLAPSVGPGAVITRLITPTVSVIHAFNGLSDADSANLGTPSFPASPSVCVGPAGPFIHAGLPIPAGKVVVEVSNDVWRITSPSGTPLFGPDNFAGLFNDNAGARGQARCVYDSKTQTYFFTELGTVQAGADIGGSTVDLAVVSPNGHAVYPIDTTQSGTCFGYQPMIGFDNNAVVISTDQVCGETVAGAALWVISKPQLVALGGAPKSVVFTALSLASTPITGLDPAINTGTGTSYLVNSFPYTSTGGNNEVSTSLGFWKITGDAALNTATGTPTLFGKVITSEKYAFPVSAKSTGSGADIGGLISDSFLDPLDSEINGPVNVTTSGGVVQLWTALDSAVKVSGFTQPVDGAAWFKINTSLQKVTSQGYVTKGGTYLLDPAMLAPAAGPAGMTFTVTSHTINPSAAYTALGSGKVTIIRAGTGPHLAKLGGDWGYYSWAARDPGTNGIWLVTEYIPSTAHQLAGDDNWGTYVFKLSS